MYEEEERFTEGFLGNLRERDRLEKQGVDGRILKRHLQEID
jgi:hypothetical protein